MKRLFLMLLATVSLIACNKGGGGTQNPPSTEQTQIFYADEIEKKDAISFNAPQAWMATVADVITRATNDNLDWLQLSAYSGAAGAQSLSLSMLPNFTGESRKAEIKIVCGETVITIIVEQKSTTEDNKAPQYKTIKRMNSMHNGKADGYIEFDYDDQQRVISCNIFKDNGSYDESYTVTYSPSQIVITGSSSEEGGTHQTMTFTVDSKGRISDRKIENSGLEVAKYTYDDQDRLIHYPIGICSHESSEGTPSDGPQGNTTITQHNVYNRNVWDGSNIKTTYEETGHADENDRIAAYEYTDRLNNSLASIDLTGGYKGVEHIILKEGCFGKKVKNLIKKETGTYTRDWSYEFDNKGNLTKFSIVCSGNEDQWTESHEIIYN